MNISTNDSANAQSSRYWMEAELINSRFAMIGFFALIHNYVLTDYIIPGLY